ncbi:hypothetical protein DUNSADRAFT_13892, partial [Dunaliella salina]
PWDPQLHTPRGSSRHIQSRAAREGSFASIARSSPSITHPDFPHPRQHSTTSGTSSGLRPHLFAPPLQAIGNSGYDTRVPAHGSCRSHAQSRGEGEGPTVPLSSSPQMGAGIGLAGLYGSSSGASDAGSLVCRSLTSHVEEGQGEGVLLQARQGRTVGSPVQLRAQPGQIKPGSDDSPPHIRGPNTLNQGTTGQGVVGLKLGADGVLSHPEQALEMVPRSNRVLDRVASNAERSQRANSVSASQWLCAGQDGPVLLDGQSQRSRGGSSGSSGLSRGAQGIGAGLQQEQQQHHHQQQQQQQQQLTGRDGQSSNQGVLCGGSSCRRRG